MEQKQLDDLDETFLNEEFIDDEPKMETETIKQESKKKTTTRKRAAKTSKTEPVVDISKSEPQLEKINVEEVKITPVKEEPAKEHSFPETKKPIDPWEDEPKESNMFTSVGTWKAIAGIAVILLVFSIFTQGFNFDQSATDNEITGASVITLSEAEQKVVTYVNTNLLQGPFEATVFSSEETQNLYKVTLNVAGQTVDSYMTKDGELFFPQGFDTSVTQEFPSAETQEPINTQEPTKVEVNTEGDPSLGSPSAPVTLVEFSDFQCSFCTSFFEGAYQQIKENYINTGKVKLVFRDFPLGFHPEAESAALAAECAHEQGKFFAYHDLLFENQNKLGADFYLKLAADLNLNEQQFNTCLTTQKYLDEVQKDFSEGQTYGVSGTPAFFINGKLITGALPYSDFAKEIEAALAGSITELEVPVEQPTEIPIEQPETPVEEPSEVTTLKMSAKRWLFSPSELTATKGSLVKLTIIPTDLSFTFSIPALGVSEQVDGTTTIEFTVNQPGTFPFTCGSCESWRGMAGTIVVE